MLSTFSLRTANIANEKTFSFQQLKDLSWEIFQPEGEKTFEEQVVLSSLESDSRKVFPGAGFLALDGIKSRGIDYLCDAIVRGAKVIFLDAVYINEVRQMDCIARSRVTFFFAQSFREKIVGLLRLFYFSDKKFPQIAAVTGTNGKTTIAYSIYALARLLGKKAGYIGTLGIWLEEEKRPNPLTTPDLVTLYQTLSDAMEMGIEIVGIEASSIALDQGRLDGIPLKAALFSNFTEDHLDYHGTMESYLNAKKLLFSNLAEQARQNPEAEVTAIINVDDSSGKKIAEDLESQVFPENFSLMRLGSDGEAKVLKWEQETQGLHVWALLSEQNLEFSARFIGAFNVQNLSLTYLTMYSLGFSHSALNDAMTKLSPPPGRMEIIPLDQQRTAVVDYAHTPDAIEKAVAALRMPGSGKLIIVFGAGGDRDREKRPLMGAAASVADIVILTSDNPRSEDPERILDDVAAGVRSTEFYREADRAKAIALGMDLLPENGILLVAGKGHEDYQIIGTEKKFFSDSETIAQLKNERYG